MVVSFVVLTILDDSFRKVCDTWPWHTMQCTDDHFQDAMRRQQTARVQAKRSLLLKRRVGYEDEEESQPRSKESKTMDVVDTAIKE